MSMPKFPEINPPIKLEDSLSLILSSIAMEELGLSHIINAEGEKIQYVLGTLSNNIKDPCIKKVSVEDLLAVNKSVKSLLDSITQNQVILKGKMECALSAIEEKGIFITGPTGATGATGHTGAPGKSGCRNIALTSCYDQCWSSGKAFEWVNSDCSRSREMYISADRDRIILEPDGCYVLSFSMNICTSERCKERLHISIQTKEAGKKVEKFGYYAPIVTDSLFTVSAAGIFISTCKNHCGTELSFVLTSPENVKVKQATAHIMKI